MCGIVGYISTTEKLYVGPKEHFMRYALALDTLRGEDSTGVITLRKRFKIFTAKTLMPGDRFVHSREYHKQVKTGWAQIGHNRSATRGNVTLENAHPFKFGDITMVHNGTLWNNGSNLQTYDKKLMVDSMQIAYALSKSPPDKAAEVLEEIDGSFALVWTDRRDESINMCRNSERPLHFTFNDKKTIMWYMSDGHHLHSINKGFGGHECRGNAIYEMDRHKILKFKKGQLKPEVIKFDPFVKAVTPFKANSAGTTGSPTKNSTKTGSATTNNTAMTTALNKWKMKEESANDPMTGGQRRSNVRIPINGRMRTVPGCMQSALRKELQLCPDDMLQFQPNDAVQMEDNTYMVFGSLIHRAWNDMSWDCTLYRVKCAQYNAYKETDWLVRPIGLCSSHEFDQNSPGVLGSLVHTDWDGFNTRLKRIEEEDNKEDEKKDILVPGPGGPLVEWSKLKPLLDGGCINCSGAIKDLKHAEWANDGLDLMCSDCVRELTDYFTGRVH